MTNNSESDLNTFELKIKQLEQSNEIMQQLLMAIPHESRAPITMIIGFANLLLMEECGTLNEKQKEFVERILAIAHRQKHIIIQIQDITYSLSSSDDKPERLEIKQFLDSDDWKIDQMGFDDSQEVWVCIHWLHATIKVLFSIPNDEHVSKRIVSCQQSGHTQHLVLHIKHTLSQKHPLSDNDFRLQSIQISAEQQGGFLNWVQLSENELEFQLGLPMFNEE